MSLFDPIIKEFENETAITRRMLALLPEEQFDWKPHPKSYSLSELASHIVNLTGWVRLTLTQDGLELDPDAHSPWKAKSRAELLESFDHNVEDSLVAFREQTDAVLQENWSMKMCGKTIWKMSKGSVLRTFIFSHMIHHRGQLTVYLRQLEVPLPSIYGPTADEPMMPGA
jgi:uncharacterized damage-inducible protein DinB